MDNAANPVVVAAASGREPEVAVLAGLLASKRRVVVHGPAGVGKSTLLRAAAERLRAQGEVERVVHLPLASGADRRWVTDVLGLHLHGPAFASMPADRRPLVLLKAVTECPTLLVWDQLDRLCAAPWSQGREAFNAVLELGVELTQTGRTRLAVATRRPDLGYVPYEPSRRAAVFEVPPLSGEAAAELAAQRGARADRAAAVVAAAAGNPLALRVWLATPGAVPEAASDPLGGALAAFRRSLDASMSDALSALAVLRDGGLLECVRELAGSGFSALAGRLEDAGLAAAVELAGRAPVPYLELQDSLGEHLRNGAGGAPAAAVRRHRHAYLQRGLAWAGADDADPALALRELPNLLLAWAASLAADRDLVAAGTDALQERLDRGATGDATLIARTLATARACGFELPGSTT